MVHQPMNLTSEQPRNLMNGQWMPLTGRGEMLRRVDQQMHQKDDRTKKSMVDLMKRPTVEIERLTRSKVDCAFDDRRSSGIFAANRSRELSDTNSDDY